MQKEKLFENKSSLGIKNKLCSSRMEFAEEVALPGQCKDTGSTGLLRRC